jgi:E3 ubiquitin-protein ligase UBR4
MINILFSNFSKFYPSITAETDSPNWLQATNEAALKRRQKLSKKLSGWKEILSDEIGHSGVTSNLLELLRSLMPAVEVQSEKLSGRLSRQQDALKLLHVAEKTTELTEQLMLPTLGSQEGAFENVRMSYSGEQVAILLSSRMIFFKWYLFVVFWSPKL